MFKSAVSVPVQMSYVVCEGSDSLQMQFPPLAAAPVENFEDGVYHHERVRLRPQVRSRSWRIQVALKNTRSLQLLSKHKGKKMGYSRTDVVVQIRIRYGEHISECRIFNFEQLQLHSITTVRGIKPTLEQWVRDTARASGASEEEIKELFLSSTSINPRGRKQTATASAIVDPPTTIKIPSSSPIVES